MDRYSYDNCYIGLSLLSQPSQACNYHMINLDNEDAVDKWIDLHYQIVWSILFVLAGVRLRRNRIALFLLSYSQFILLVCLGYHHYYPKVLRILIDLSNFSYAIFLENLKCCSACSWRLLQFSCWIMVKLQRKVVIFIKIVVTKDCKRYN